MADSRDIPVEVIGLTERDNEVTAEVLKYFPETEDDDDDATETKSNLSESGSRGIKRSSSLRATSPTPSRSSSISPARAGYEPNSAAEEADDEDDDQDKRIKRVRRRREVSRSPSRSSFRYRFRSREPEPNLDDLLLRSRHQVGEAIRQLHAAKRDFETVLRAISAGQMLSLRGAVLANSATYEANQASRVAGEVVSVGLNIRIPTEVEGMERERQENEEFLAGIEEIQENESED